MTAVRDLFTSTVDGAAAFERAHSIEPYDDQPTLADVAEQPEPQPAGPCITCDGQGEIGTAQDYFGNWDSEACRDCAGTGDCPGNRGSATTAGVLLFLICGGLLFLAALHLGQQAMCDLSDQGLRYCPGFSTTNDQEIP